MRSLILLTLAPTGVASTLAQTLERMERRLQAVEQRQKAVELRQEVDEAKLARAETYREGLRETLREDVSGNRKINHTTEGFRDDKERRAIKVREVQRYRDNAPRVAAQEDGAMATEAGEVKAKRGTSVFSDSKLARAVAAAEQASNLADTTD